MGGCGEFGELMAMDERLTLSGEKPHLGGKDLGPADGLLTTSGFTVSLEGVTRRGDSLILEGRVTARGIAIDREPDIKISIGLGRRRFSARWVQRVDRPERDGSWSAFRAAVPLQKWPAGEYFPRLVMTASGGESNPRMLKTAALFRNGRPVSHEDFVYEVGTNAKNQASVSKKKRASLPFRGVKRALADLTARDGYGHLRLLARLLRKFSSNQTWLIGERWDNAQDNGVALFRHVSKNTPDGVRPVYVLEKSSPAFRSLSREGIVVSHGSMRHRLEVCRATTMISAFDVDSYLIPRDWVKADYLEKFLSKLGTKRVFLQHGVTSRTANARGMHRLVVGYDLVIVSSDAERKYFSKELGYGRRAVATGMPRLDGLERIHSQYGRVILFAPTWRPNLVVPSYSSKGEPVGRDNFEASAYFRTIREILESPRLNQMLVDENAELRFLPHYEATRFFAESIEFSSRVKIASLDERTFQEWLRIADAFITDYSSSSFDVALMGTPVVYLDDSSDPDRELTRSGAFFDADSDGFGPAVEGVDNLVDALERIAANDFRMEDGCRANAERFFDGVEIGRCAELTAAAIKRI